MDKMMSKGQDNNFLNNLNTCVLKVNIHCDGCLKKVKKLLHKVDGVYNTSIDADQGKVTVVGCVDSATLIEKLEKAGKHAEEWPTKVANKKNLTNQLQNLQLDPAKLQQLQQHHKDNNIKLSNGGAGIDISNGKGKGKDHKGGQKPPPPQQKQKKKEHGKGLKEMLSSLKDLKFPFKKDKKTVKFQGLSEDEDSEGELSDGNDLGIMGAFGDEFMDDVKKVKGKNAPVTVKDKNGPNGGGGNGKKGGALAQVINKAKNAKNGNKKGGNNKGVNGYDNQANGGKKGNGGKNDGMIGNGHQPNMMGHGCNGMNFGPMGNMQHNIGQMGQFPAVQGLPAGAGGVPAGYYGAGMVPQDMNPYQQQYMQALLQQQQQRRMMMMNGQGGVPAAYPQMGYGYGYSQPAAYVPHVPSSYTMFSDENPHGCSIM